MDPLKAEVDRNYDWLQRHLGQLLVTHRSQYVLLKSATAIDFFDSPGDAYRQGLARYPDMLFSVQLVTDEPVELGMMAVAFD